MSLYWTIVLSERVRKRRAISKRTTPTQAMHEFSYCRLSFRFRCHYCYYCYYCYFYYSCYNCYNCYCSYYSYYSYYSYSYSCCYCYYCCCCCCCCCFPPAAGQSHRPGLKRRRHLRRTRRLRRQRPSGCWPDPRSAGGML